MRMFRPKPFRIRTIRVARSFNAASSLSLSLPVGSHESPRYPPAADNSLLALYSIISLIAFTRVALQKVGSESWMQLLCDPECVGCDAPGGAL